MRKIQECYCLSLLLLFFRAGSHETQSQNAAPFSASDQVQEVTDECKRFSLQGGDR